MRTITIITASVLVAACLGGHKSEVAPRIEWKGRTAADVIAKWGQPQATLNDQHGGKILVYIRDKETTTPGQWTTQTIPNGPVDSTGMPGPAATSQTYTPGTTAHYTEITRFSVDAKGVIYEWSTKKQ